MISLTEVLIQGCLVLVSATHTGLSDVASQATIRFLRVVLGLDEAGKCTHATDAGARSLLVPGIPVDGNSKNRWMSARRPPPNQE
jgi:hypothetical protein